jgi:deoxyribodipyrimidine photolyase-like uncharacterized protein
MNPEELAYDAAREWKQRALDAEAQLEAIRTENRRLCLLCADMRAWRDRVRAEYQKLHDAYWHEDNVCGELRCELIEGLEEAIRS